MAFWAREATYEDLQECVRVERETMGDYTYLSDVWDYYFATSGAVVCVFDGDMMAGIGRISVLPDNTGWLECLRVAPDYQNKGAGKLIYESYLKIADCYRCKSLGMFTGPTNARSAGLAQKFGLTETHKHFEFSLPVSGGGSPHGFAPVTWQRAQDLVLPLREQYHGFYTFNRTFYRINADTAAAFANEGKVYEDKTTGSFIVCGGRFQHHKCLHIAMMDGDFAACVDFAKNLAAAQNIPRISVSVCGDNPRLTTALKNLGFTPSEGYLITKTGPVK